MASRFESFMADLEAAYAGAADTEWFFGAEHIFDYHNWNRIVLWPGGGYIGAPKTAAMGITTATGGRDDKVWQRNPQLSIGIWAQNYEQAENRLHAVLIAIDDVISQADINVANLNENWLAAENQDNTSDGVTVVLTMNVSFDVLAHDVDIVEWDAAAAPVGPRPDVGDGGPTDTVTQVTNQADLDGTDVPPDVMT